MYPICECCRETKLERSLWITDELCRSCWMTRDNVWITGLVEAREEKGLTQLDVAQRCGWSQKRQSILEREDPVFIHPDAREILERVLGPLDEKPRPPKKSIKDQGITEERT